MKRYLMSLLALLFYGAGNAQSSREDSLIRSLEQQEVKAVLTGDSVTLLRLWDARFIVNAPDNGIYGGGGSTLDRPVLRRSRTAFTRQTEKILFQENLAICMGAETVVGGGPGTISGKIIQRRYTNIWMKNNDSWQLVARHANIICDKPTTPTKSTN